MLVVWTENAKENLQDYLQHSKIINKDKVQEYVNGLIDYIDNLQEFNRLGRFLFNRNGLEVRQLIYKNHRIFYPIGNRAVHILLVIHTTRDMNNIIKYLKNKNYIIGRYYGTSNFKSPTTRKQISNFKR